MQDTDVLIIGAGITGLLCATELTRAGYSVCILDKGRGAGGRMATRRMSGARLDHGAQFFTVRNPLFQVYVDQWLKAGVIREWFRFDSHDSNLEGYSRYCGINGMSDVPKYLAKELVVYNSIQVSELVRDGTYWCARTQDGLNFSAQKIVITVPLPQALMLLDTSGLNYAGVDQAALHAVRYEKGLATLAILDGPSGLPSMGARRVENSPITWIADNQMKGISPDVCAVTIHASADFSAAHWGSADEVRGALMLEAASTYLKANVLEYSCHRWGFTRVLNPWRHAYYSNDALQLILAGDAFGGDRVEGAGLSGIAAAGHLIAERK
jgi:renalase